MGQLCSPDRMENNAREEPNTQNSRKRPTDISNGQTEESVASYSNGQTVGAARQITESQSVVSYRASDADLLDELSIERSTSEPSKQYDVVDDGDGRIYEDDTDRIDYDNSNNSNNSPISERERQSLSKPKRDSKHTHTNTSRGGLKAIDTKDILSSTSSLKKKSSGFQIVVTPADNTDENGGYSPLPNGAKKQTNGNENDDSGNNKESEEDEEDLIMKKRKQKIDSTLGGAISWKKVADFSALLPRDVKLKLWNGVFKTESDYSQPELKRISKVLRTFVMLQLTRV